MASVEIDPTLPLHVTVDFQSRHRASFRLFTRGPNETDPWVFLKEGSHDTTVVAMPLARNSRFKSEFIFFSEPDPFRAVLIFRQNGHGLEGGTRAVDAPGDELFVADTAELG